MYRDDREAARARVIALIERQERTATEIRERLDAIAELRVQLRKKGLDVPVEVPAVELATTAVDPEADLGGLVRVAGEAETRAEQLERELEGVARVFALLNDRVQGRTGSVLPVAPGPRSVPLRYLIAELAQGGWMIVKNGMWFPPVWILPAAGPVIALTVTGCVLALGLLRVMRRYRFLRWGVPLDVHVIDTSATSSEYTNWPIRIARGWDVVTESYTGEGRRSRVAYLGSDGAQYEMSISGIGYQGGVVLGDPRHPASALPIERFAAPPRPDHRGQWIATAPVTAWLKLAIVVGYFGACIAVGFSVAELPFSL